jgi:hypothetical protein
MSNIKIYSYADENGTERLSYVPLRSLSSKRWREVNSPVLYKPSYGYWCGSCRMSKGAALLYRILDMGIDYDCRRSLKTASAAMKDAAENRINFGPELMLATNDSLSRSTFLATANGKLYVQIYNHHSDNTELVTIKNMRVTSRVKVRKAISFKSFINRAIKVLYKSNAK